MSFREQISQNYRDEIYWIPNPVTPWQKRDVISHEGSAFVYYHNESSFTAHPDDSTRWSPYAKRGLPGEDAVVSAVLTPPTITGPTQVSAGDLVSLTASGSSLVWGNSVLSHYEWQADNATHTGTTFDFDTTGSVAGFLVIRCRAVDILNEHSDWTTKTIAVTVVDQSPSMAAFVATLPTTVNAGETYNFGFSGAVDPEGATVHYVVADIMGATFVKTNNIYAPVGVTVATGPQSLVFTVFAQDYYGNSSEGITFTIPIKYPPLVGLATLSLPAKLNAQTATDFVISGVVNTGGAALTYSFSDLVGCTIAPHATMLDTFTLTTQSETTCSFNMRATTTTGDVSAIKAFAYDVNLWPASEAITTSLAAYLQAGTAYPVFLTGATDPDGDSVIYQFGTITGGAITSQVVNGETVDFFTPDGSNTAYSIAVRCTDGSLFSNWKTFTGNVNVPPVATNVVSTAPGLFTSTTPVAFSLSGGTDSNVGDSLTYEIINPVNCSFSKTTGIVGGESITIAASGHPVSYDVKAVDGSGRKSGAKSFQHNYNRPPVSLGCVMLWPSVLVRGVASNTEIVDGLDPDNDAVSYVVVGTSGCTTDVATTTGPLVVTPIYNATTVWIEVKVVDTHGLESAVKRFTFAGTLSSPTADITVPAGTSQTITIPAGIAGTVTVDGNGGKGAAASGTSAAGYTIVKWTETDVTHLPLPAVTGVSTTSTYYGWPDALADSVNSPIIGSYLFLGTTTASGIGVGGTTDSTYAWYLNQSYNSSKFVVQRSLASAGLPSTLSGAIAKTFNGAASGVTTAPASTQQLFSVDPATTHTVTVSAAANGGSVRIRY